MDDEDSGGRRLGWSEAVCAEMFDQLPCGLQVVAAARLTHVPDIRAVAASADAVRARHALLGCSITRDGEGAWWFRPAPEARPDVTAVHRQSWRDRYVHALRSPLGPGGLPWRAELLVGPTDDEAPAFLVVTGHHAVLDGVALAALVAELVDGPAPHSPAPPLAPPVEDLLPRRPAGTASPAPAAAAPGTGWPVDRAAPPADRRLGVTTLELGAGVVDGLRRGAHAAATTVNAALMSALCTVQRQAGAVAAPIGFNVPADLRRRLDPPLPPGQIGCYFARPHVWDHGDADLDPWARARALETAFTADLTASFDAGPAWRPADVAATVRALCRPERDRFDLSFLLSDLGRLDLGSAVTGLWFTTVQTAGVEALVVSAASVGEGLQLTVAWPEPLLATKTALALSARFEATLVELARS